MPSVIIADLAATAALAAAARAAPSSSFYHHSRLLLFLDEPNMGVQLDAEVGRGGVEKQESKNVREHNWGHSKSVDGPKCALRVR